MGRKRHGFDSIKRTRDSDLSHLLDCLELVSVTIAQLGLDAELKPAGLVFPEWIGGDTFLVQVDGDPDFIKRIPGQANRLGQIGDPRIVGDLVGAVGALEPLHVKPASATGEVPQGEL